MPYVALTLEVQSGGGQEEGQSNDAFRPVDPGAEVLQLLRALQILYLNL
jgi:hypothetical protein